MGPQIRSQRLRNLLHSVFLIGGMLLLLAAVGRSLGGSTGLVVVLVAGGTLLVLMPRVSPRLILRLYRARPLRREDAPLAVDLIRELSRRGQLPRIPEPYLVPSGMVNAFAVGSPEHSAIGITAGLLRGLDRRELAGVLAHEISHIRRRDTWVMSLADVITRATHGLSVVGQVLLLLNFPLLLMGALTVPWSAVLLLILAPTLSGLLQLALSRAREYDADLGAVELTGDPRGLASALGRLERLNAGWMERIFLPGRRVPDPSLLRTHPSTAERIRRLLELEGRPSAVEPPDRMMPEVAAGAVRIPVRVVRGPRWHLSGLWY